MSTALPSPDSLRLEAKAAQMCMIDIPGHEMTPEVRAHLGGHAWNGVILFAKNVDRRGQVVALVNAIHEASEIAPLISVDQEGGLVDRFRFEEMSLSPGCMNLGAGGEPEATFRAHRIMGRELRDLGIHVDFAPDLDVNVNADNPIIGVRSFGEDPALVAEHGRAAIRGLREGGVAPTAKHFPGHGDTAMDSHIGLPSLPHSRERLEAVELLPFRAAVEEGVEAIMTAHVTFPALDPREGLPATLSRPVLTGLLREEMGYDGLIVTDSMAMKAVADNFGLEEAAVQSVEAGADLILALGPFPDQVRTVQALVEAVRSGRLAESRLDESLRRIFELKRRHAQLPSEVPTWDVEAHKSEMAAVAARGVTLVVNRDGMLPLKADERVLVLAPDLLPVSPLGEVSVRAPLAPYLGANVEERSFHLSGGGPPVSDLARRAAEADAVVLALYARDRLPDAQRELARAVLEANPRTVLVSLSSPYILRDLPDVPACLLGYNYGAFTLAALADVLRGRRSPTGRLPVSIPGLFAAGHGLSYG